MRTRRAIFVIGVVLCLALNLMGSTITTGGGTSFSFGWSNSYNYYYDCCGGGGQFPQPAQAGGSFSFTLPGLATSGMTLKSGTISVGGLTPDSGVPVYSNGDDWNVVQNGGFQSFSTAGSSFSLGGIYSGSLTLDNAMLDALGKGQPIDIVGSQFTYSRALSENGNPQSCGFSCTNYNSSITGYTNDLPHGSAHLLPR